MAFINVRNISLRGISAAVPEKKEYTSGYNIIPVEEREKLASATGIDERRIASELICTSDLCYHAAVHLIRDLKWEKETIEALIFVTQTPDYILPSTAPILQERLGLNESCLAFDISIGCSGYIYGLNVLGSLISHGNIKRGILLAGDTISKTCSVADKSTYPLFGDAGTATAIEYEQNSTEFRFSLSSDGREYKSIIIKDGGSRNPATINSFKIKEYDAEIKRNDLQLELDGMNVFSFGITRAPESVLNLLERYNLEISCIDYFIFHQANLFLNETIRQKLKLEKEKVPYSLNKFGNTSSASIPLTIVNNLNKILSKGRHSLILCGFGVGLSWGSAHFVTDNIICPDIIEV